MGCHIFLIKRSFQLSIRSAISISTILLSFLQFVSDAESNPLKNKAQEENDWAYSFSSESKKIDIFADLLLWGARESGTEIWSQIFTTIGSTTTDDIIAIPFGWDLGFRAGFDYPLNDELWDTKLYYTFFRTEGKNRAASGGEITSSFLGNFYINNTDGASDSGPTYHNSGIQWKILFNMFDLELGRKYIASRFLLLRPSLGLKGGWINQSINSTWQNPLAGAFTSATENLENNFFGFGPNLGLDSEWELFSLYNYPLSLFADIAVALMYGHWAFKDIYQNNAGSEVSIASPAINSGETVLRSFFGISWGKPNFSIRCGYETQFWFDQLRIYTLSIGRLNNTLTLQGGTLDLHVSF